MQKWGFLGDRGIHIYAVVGRPSNLVFDEKITILPVDHHNGHKVGPIIFILGPTIAKYKDIGKKIYGLVIIPPPRPWTFIILALQVANVDVFF
jgi:hypothetical protein